MKNHKIVLACSLIAIFILAGVTFLEPAGTHGQLKEKMTPSTGKDRDPFSFPSGIHLLSKNKTAPVVAADLYPDMRVKAILIGDHIRLALIGRHVVSVGDSINDEKVFEIKPDKVILEKGRKKRTLLLEQSTIPIIVEEKGKGE